MGSAAEIWNDLQEPEAPKKPKLKKWVPKRWRPEYERIVAYAVLGLPNTVIADKVNKTPQHISNILNLPEAQRRQLELLEKLKKQVDISIPETLEYVAQKTTERLKSLIDNDELFEKSPFAVIDRGMDVLKGLSHLRGGGNGSGPTVNGNVIILPAGAAQNLMEGLSKADEAVRMHQLNPANEVKADV